ncbi:hypothetical protein N6B72_12215 [Chryseobacterium soli]|uniref:hypothetical protein n=1 Tax=Chryseobacterium soli TaxID=445961 RepID=UPI002954C72A|nr:hypothetical protein [Chryseobacterium soli]MDV7697685.1 hypothetical protein [Chryseobacterium soli]
MKKCNNRLFNAVLPLFFFEWWYILIAFVAVIIVETFILSKFFRIKFKFIWHEVLIMNIFSTLGGFLIQGIIRLLLGISIFNNFENYSEFPLLDIIFGNVAYPVNSKITNEIIFDLIISLLITLAISIFMEYYSIKRNKIFNDLEKHKILKGVVIVNATSYILLSIWLFYKLNHF